jgi:superfamily I DNA/RNA helicase
MFNLDSLNPQQRQAVTTIRGPVLILAGAGTGKTRVITCRIAHLIRKGISPGNILAVTFTNKAAREMKERVAEMVPREARTTGEKGEGLTISTFHSFGSRVLRQHIEKLGYKKNFVIYDDAEQQSAIKKILSRISIKGEKTEPRDVQSLISKFKNGAFKPGEFGSETALSLARYMLKHYETALRACNAIDFDDLLVLTLRLLKEHPEVLADCRAKYQYIMVDEYQDTNAAQFELVNLLAQEHRNLCVVGDDDQSIYGWRGAEIANLLDLEKHFPEVKVIKLEQNYRSTNTILLAANAVIKNNARRRPKQLWSDKGQGEKIILAAFQNDEEEARTLVEEIEFDRMAHGIPWKDQAVLFRTNQQSRSLETALRQAKVRYHLVGGQSFFDRREVRDMLAYLKVCTNPNDDISLLRIANVPARGLSDVTMERLLTASQQRHSSVFTAMHHTDVLNSFQTRTQESIQEFLQFLEEYRNLLTAPGTESDPEGLLKWTKKLLTDSGYINELRRSEKNVEVGDSRVRNLMDLIANIDGSGLNPLPERLQHYLENVTLDNDRDSEEEDPGDAVTLITMHSCKGLEYPHVHIVGVEDGLLPHSRSKEEGTMDEERRLFYVAITRAQKTLTISYSLGRKKYGQTIPSQPSPFLRELPEELVERELEGAKKPVTGDTSKKLFDMLRASIQ